MWNMTWSKFDSSRIDHIAETLSHSSTYGLRSTSITAFYKYWTQRRGLATWRPEVSMLSFIDIQCQATMIITYLSDVHNKLRR